MIAESLTLPIAVATLTVYRGELRWGYVAAAIGCIVVALAFVLVSVLRVRRRGQFDVDPVAAFIMACLSLVAAELAEVATGSRLGLFKPALLVGVVFVGLVGDRTMRVLVTVVAVVLVAASAWLEGIRGGDYATLVVVWGWAFVAVAWMTERWARNIEREAESRSALRTLADTLASHDAVLDDALPVVADVLPSDAVVVVAGDEAGTQEVAAQWPAGEVPSLDVLATLPALGQARATGEVAVDGEWCALPVGFEDGRLLVLLIHHEREYQETDAEVHEVAKAIAGILLAMTNRAAFVSTLRHESRTDPLTGLANRRSLLERMADEMGRAARVRRPLCVAMIDLDHFKEYNDARGHVTGDTALRALASQMVSKVREQDLVARYGGEEFCVVLPYTGSSGAATLMEGIRAAVDGLDIPTLSIGIAEWDGTESATGLIERADAALYRAKAAGRNRVVTAAIDPGADGFSVV